MNFLFVCTTYPANDNDTYMTSELALALTSQGHSVDVIHINWNGNLSDGNREYQSKSGINICEIAPRAISNCGNLIYKISKFIFTGNRSLKYIKQNSNMKNYDCMITWTPALSVANFIKYAKKNSIRNRILFIFDFFPIHHREIGLIPSGPIYWIAKYLENNLYKMFNVIICNLPSNINYLKKNYRLTNDQIIISSPLWSDTTPVIISDRMKIRSKFKIPINGSVAIFGGQITEGRGIEQILKAAQLLEISEPNIVFLFIGSGRLVDYVKLCAQSFSNIIYLLPVDRDTYLEILTACDIGLVATVEGVSSFSFPTKTIDYLRADLPIVATVESGSDYNHIIESYDLGKTVPVGDSKLYAQAIIDVVLLSKSNSLKSENRKKCLDELFDVRNIASLILSTVK